MKSLVVKRSILIGGHKTSVSLEEAFWTGLKEIAGKRNASLSELVATIDTERELGNLSSAIRLFVLGFYRDRITKKGPDTGARRSEGRRELGQDIELVAEAREQVIARPVHHVADLLEDPGPPVGRAIFARCRR